MLGEIRRILGRRKRINYWNDCGRLKKNLSFWEVPGGLSSVLKNFWRNLRNFWKILGTNICIINYYKSAFRNSKNNCIFTQRRAPPKNCIFTQRRVPQKIVYLPYEGPTKKLYSYPTKSPPKNCIFTPRRAPLFFSVGDLQNQPQKYVWCFASFVCEKVMAKILRRKNVNLSSIKSVF